MKSNKILILVLLVLSSVILVACKTEDIVSHGGPTKDYVSLIDSLRVAGATVEPALENPTPVQLRRTMMKVNGESIGLSEYESEKEADEAVKDISPSAGSGAIFYKSGKIIVHYRGNTAQILSLLEQNLGEPIVIDKFWKKEITNFKDCVNAGYPMMESYPRQCKTPDGKTFVEEVENKEMGKIIETEKGELKLAHKDHKVVLTGTLERSTPCVNWTAQIGGSKNLPYRAEIYIDIFDSNKGAICIQMLGEPQELYEEINSVSEETKYTVKIEQEVVFEGKLNE